MSRNRRNDTKKFSNVIAGPGGAARTVGGTSGGNLATSVAPRQRTGSSYRVVPAGPNGNSGASVAPATTILAKVTTVENRPNPAFFQEVVAAFGYDPTVPGALDAVIGARQAAQEADRTGQGASREREVEAAAVIEAQDASQNAADATVTASEPDLGVHDAPAFAEAQEGAQEGVSDFTD